MVLNNALTPPQFVCKMVTLFFIQIVILLNKCVHETLVGKVVGVTDGDTITVLDGQQTQHKIRLMGVDCSGPDVGTQ